MFKSISNIASKIIGTEKKSVQSKSYYLMLGGQLSNIRYNSRELAYQGYIKNVIGFRCISLITNQAKTIDYKLINKSTEKEIDKHPLLDLLNNPYFNVSKTEFMARVFSQHLIFGDSFIWKIYPDDNQIPQSKPPNMLYPLRPDCITYDEGKNFLVNQYHYSDSYNSQDFKVSITGESNLIHMKTYNPESDYLGLSPVIPAFYSIDIHNSGSNWNRSLLKNSGRPSGVLEVPADTDLTDDQVDRLRAELESSYSGDSNAGRPILLEGGMKWNSVSFSVQDASLIESKKQAAHEIALAYNIPMQLLNQEQAKFDNLQEAYVQLWEEAVLPLLKQYFDELNMDLASLYGSDLELKPDLKGTTALIIKEARERESLEKVTYMTINEKRDSIGLLPVAGGDTLFVKINDVPLKFANSESIDDEQKLKYIERELKRGTPIEEAKYLSQLIFSDDLILSNGKKN